MTGVGFAHNPNEDATDDSTEIHLWKSDGPDGAVSYCTAHAVDSGLSGMTQLTKSVVEQWENNDSVCDECVEEVRETHY